jgi:hypothetical protein
MKLADIPRNKVGVLTSPTRELDGLNSERAKLATRAADLLGYKALAEHVSGRTMIAATDGKLTETLKSLALEVLDTGAVLQYQMEEVGRLTLEKIKEDFKSWINGYFSPAQWHQIGISDYERAIPEFVIDKAVRIKEVLPEVQFRIQYLSEPKADPFLIAIHGKEIYYVDAWDEPRFETTL